MKKIDFTDSQIIEIKNYYLIDNLSCKEIGDKFNVSKRPINNILRNYGLLKKGYSDGKKIELTHDVEEKIKKLYLEENKNCHQIGEELNLSKHFVDKYLSSSNYRRNKGQSISLRQSGKKRSKEVVEILKSAQQKLSKSGKRKQVGGVCKKYNVHGLECQGTYEKFYIEKLFNENVKLPNNSKGIETPIGVYYPDFSFDDKFVEIKSDYTYDVLLGNKVCGYTKKINKDQYNKIKWVNENIMSVEIIVVDKRNNKLIKKQIT